MQDRLSGSDLIGRSISVIIQSYEAGGDISETMDSIARDASKIKDAEKERRSVLFQQVIIIYAIYFLFLGILVALYNILIPLLNIGGSGGGGFISTPPNFCSGGSVAQPVCSLCPALGLGDTGTRLCYYKSIFLLMLIVPMTVIAFYMPLPGGLGGVEVLLVSLLVVIAGVQPHVASAAVILHRTTVYLLPTLLGAGLLWHLSSGWDAVQEGMERGGEDIV